MAGIRRRIRKAIFKFQPFSPKQKQILTWWTEGASVKDKDGIIADGAIRSGKTVSMSLSYVMWAMDTFNETNLGMAGKTIGSFRRNVLKDLVRMLASRGYRVKDRRADNYLEVSKGDSINYFYIFGGKDESSQDLIQGITLGGMFFDEVALMPESFVNQATGRCSIDGSKFWFNCNPDGPYHWFKTKWIDSQKDKNLVYLHFTMEDNLSLSERVKARYRSMYSGVFYKRYIQGLWTVAEGIVYDMFDQAKHTFKDFVQGLDTKTYVSVDYGTQNATVYIMWKKDRAGKWCAVKEYYYSGRDMKKQKTDVEFVDDLLEFTAGEKIERVVVDPSAASFIAQAKKKGFKIKRARNDVLDGIRFVATLLNEEKISFSEACENTIKEFSSYVWDEKATNRGEDKPTKENDHAMDAIRYFCYTIINKRGGTSIWK